MLEINERIELTHSFEWKNLLLCLSQILKFLPLVFRFKILQLLKILPQSLWMIWTTYYCHLNWAQMLLLWPSVYILVCPAQLKMLDVTSEISRDTFWKFAGRLPTSVSPNTVWATFSDCPSKTIVRVKINRLTIHALDANSSENYIDVSIAKANKWKIFHCSKQISMRKSS